MNDDFFEPLNESTQETLEPKIGDYLYCHKSVVMVSSSSTEATEGRFYPIIDIKYNNSRLYIKNNSDGEHIFSLDPKENWHYSVWFHLIPKEYYDEMEDSNPFDSLEG